MGDEGRVGGEEDFDGQEVIALVGWSVPIGQTSAVVDVLAHDDVALQNFAEGIFPRFVAADSRGGAVGVGDFELEQLPGLLAVELAASPFDVAAIPAVTEDAANRVLAIVEEVADVEDLIAHPVGVIGPAGGEFLVADTDAVDLGLVYAQSGDIKPSSFD